MIKKLAHVLYWKLVPKRWRFMEVLQRVVVEKTGNRVYAGPFKGLKYGSESHGSVFVPKLLGTYELELHPQVEAIVALHPRTIVNLGTAEGYYTVGLAKRLPGCRLIGFDLAETARRLTRELAERNGVESQIELHGNCTPEAMAALKPAAPHVVLCDIEGGEDAVLQPERVPWLAQSTLLVELHDFEVPGIEATLRRRFEPTHHLRVIQQTPRLASQFPFRTRGTAWFPDQQRAQMLSEWRPAQMSWLYAVPRSGGV